MFRLLSYKIQLSTSSAEKVTYVLYEPSISHNIGPKSRNRCKKVGVNSMTYFYELKDSKKEGSDIRSTSNRRHSYMKVFLNDAP